MLSFGSCRGGGIILHPGPILIHPSTPCTALANFGVQGSREDEISSIQLVMLKK